MPKKNHFKCLYFGVLNAKIGRLTFMKWTPGAGIKVVNPGLLRPLIYNPEVGKKKTIIHHKSCNDLSIFEI